MNENIIVKEYEFDNPLIQNIDSIIDDCYRDYHNKYFHTFKYVCIYDIKLTKITNNEIINITISDNNTDMFELNKKLTLARQRGFTFNQINKLKIKFYTPLSQNNIHRYLKFQCPILVRQILKTISRNPESIQAFCNIFHNLELIFV